MQRTTAQNNVAQRFSDNDPATVVDAAWLNGVQEELIKLIVAAGLTPDAEQTDQVLTALAHHVATLEFYTAAAAPSGPETIYTLTRNESTAPYPPQISAAQPVAHGTAARFVVPSDSAASNKIKISERAEHPIKYFDATGDAIDVSTGFLRAGQLVRLVYNKNIADGAWCVDRGVENLTWAAIDAAVSAVGLSPDVTDSGLFLRALSHHVGVLDYYDSVTVTNSTFTITKTNPEMSPLPQYDATEYPLGMTVRFVVPATASPANPELRIITPPGTVPPINGPARRMRRVLGEELDAGELASGSLVAATFDGMQWLISSTQAGTGALPSASGNIGMAQFYNAAGHDIAAVPADAQGYKTQQIQFNATAYNNIDGLSIGGGSTQNTIVFSREAAIGTAYFDFTCRMHVDSLAWLVLEDSDGVDLQQTRYSIYQNQGPDSATAGAVIRAKTTLSHSRRSFRFVYTATRWTTGAHISDIALNITQIIATLGEPTNISVTTTATTATVSWHAPAGGPAPTHYYVRRSEDTDMTNPVVASVDAVNTDHEFTGLTPGTTYYYQVKSVIEDTDGIIHQTKFAPETPELAQTQSTP